MRTLIVALGLAAIATGPALAQNVSRGSTSANASGSSTLATTPGNVTGTNGSTATSNATTSATTTGTTSSTSGLGFAPLPGGSATDVNPSASSTSTTNPADSRSFPLSSASPTNVTSDIHAATPGNSFGPNGPFANDSGNTALGTSPGQSSSGTFAGNSSQGIGADSAGLNNGVANTGNVTLVPEGAVSVIGGGGSGARVVGVPNAVSPQGTAPGAGSATPLFDQAAREGRAREARRRAQGNEPRVYGIAPNTERDLTWQMPDDKIIRY